MFLATTALRQFWDRGQPQRLLGDWCRPDGPADGEVMPSPWLDRDRFDQAAAYVDEVTEFYLGHLAAYLDGVHGVAHGPRYWRIAIGDWLLHVVSATYDKYICLTEALREDPALTTRGVADSAATALAAKLLEPDEQLHFQQLRDYTALLRGMGHAVPVEDLAVPDGAAARIVARLRRKQASRARRAGRIRGLDYQPGGPHARGGPAPDILIGALHCPAAMHARLRDELGPGVGIDSMQDVELPTGRLPWRTWRAVWGPLVWRKARRGLASLPARNEFERVFVQLLPDRFPVGYLEAFSVFRDQVLGLYRGFPRLIVAVPIGPALKLYAAEGIARGATRLAAVQHGTPTGAWRWFPQRGYERAISDRYFAWGWAADGDRHYHNVPCLKNSFLVDGSVPAPRYREHATILFVRTRGHDYCDFFSSSLYAHGHAAYCAWQARFFAALGPAHAAHVVCRAKHDNARGWQDRLAARFPALRFDDSNLHHGASFIDRLLEARIVIVDHSTHAYTEAMALDVPTVVYWDPAIWQTRPEAAPWFDALHRAGILWYDPEQAAAHVQAIYDDPDRWWRRADVQTARTRFLARLARPSADWLAEWSAAIRAELALAPATDPVPAAARPPGRGYLSRPRGHLAFTTP